MKIKVNLIGEVKINELRKSVELFKKRHPKGDIDIYFYDFKNEMKMNEFKEMFPKYVKMKECKNQYGIMLNVTMSVLNRITGDRNEESEKRLNKIIEILNKM